MARPPKGKPLTMRPVRLDDDVWAECQRLGKAHGTINEGLRARILQPFHPGTVRMLPPRAAQSGGFTQASTTETKREEEMKELTFSDERQYEAAQEIQAEIRQRNPVVFKPIPMALAVLESEQEEMLSRLDAAGVEYNVAHDVAVSDSHFLASATEAEG